MRLESVLDVAPHIKDWYEQDVSVLVTDLERVIKTYMNPRLDIGFREGDLVPEQSAAYKVIQAGQRIIARITDKTKFTIPYVAISNPIIDNEIVVGAISLVVSIEQYDKLVSMGEELLAAVEEIAASAENLSAQGEEYSATAKTMHTETQNAQKDIAHVTRITDEIKRLSAQSNILGINASIESARAGEYGRGFAVVAQEVKKLADNTKRSAGGIEADIEQVRKSVRRLVDAVSALANTSEAQTIGIVELTKAVTHIADMAQELVVLGKNIG